MPRARTSRRGSAVRAAAARRAAALGAHREAAAQYARALRYSDRMDDVARAGTHTLHSLECYITADEENGVASIDAAIDIYRRLGDEPRLAATLRWRALALLNWGLAAEAQVAAREAVGSSRTRLPGTSSP